MGTSVTSVFVTTGTSTVEVLPCTCNLDLPLQETCRESDQARKMGRNMHFQLPLCGHACCQVGELLPHWSSVHFVKCSSSDTSERHSNAGREQSDPGRQIYDALPSERHRKPPACFVCTWPNSHHWWWTWMWISGHPRTVNGNPCRSSHCIKDNDQAM